MKKRNVILLHCLFWVLLVVKDTIPAMLGDAPVKNGNPLAHLLITAGYNSIAVVCLYGAYFFVARTLVVQRRYLAAIFRSLLVLAMVVAWRYFLEFHIFKPLLGFDNYKGQIPSVRYYLLNVFYYYFPSYYVYGLMYFFAQSWYEGKQREQQTLQEKLKTELSFLRSQINPHFLFNTINDIYVLTYQKADQAPDALMKLSEMLRYMLHESQNDKVPLEKEISYIENMIDLQKISAKGNAFIQLNVEGEVLSQMVAPMLFISFIENSFKHGVLNDPLNPVIINLHIDNELRFECINKKNHSQKDKTGGIGLENTRRRLHLLYSENHTLMIEDKLGFFRVLLILPFQE